MDRNTKAKILMVLNAVAIVAIFAAPVILGIKSGDGVLPYVCGIGTIFVFGFISNIVQLMFVHAVKTDDALFDLIMPWSLANLWDKPEDYFPPGVDRAYRAYRIILNVAGPVVFIGAVVYIFMAL